MSSDTLSTWTEAQRELLQFERECEISSITEKIKSLSAKECEDAGLSLLHMVISSTSSALFGRCRLSMERSNGQQLIRTFKVGDEVVLYSPKLMNTPESIKVDGIVTKLHKTSIEIICDEVDEQNFDRSIRIDIRFNDSTHQKYLTLLGDLENSPTSLVNLLFAEEDCLSQLLQSFSHSKKPLTEDMVKEIEFVNSKLNDSQQLAVIGALETKQISVIHGPPGTGKTSTVVEIIHQLASRRRKVLVCAPSNVAVDNILERLISANDAFSSAKGKGNGKQVRLVRLGHPARASPKSAQYCLDSLIASHDGTEIVADVQSEIDGLRKEILKCSRKSKVKRREMQAEVRILCKEARKREEAVVKEILKGADVVLCTCVTAGSRLLRNIVFDISIIDEAAQALEVSCWIPMMMASSCVLVGDHKQLPPTVKSAQAASKGLALTLFERVIRNKSFQKASLVFLLNTQYRMNLSICAWASQHMYGGQLLSHESVADRTVKDLLLEYGIPTSNPTESLDSVAPSVTLVEAHRSDLPDAQVQQSLCFKDEGVLPVALLLDTTGSGMLEEACDEGSKKNYGEADVVLKHVLYLLDVIHVRPRDIGVITPYSGQLGLLKQLFAEHSGTDPRISLVEVKTIDGFQGGEKECIIISMVRSNLKREVGFLGDKRRINVAVTRSKVHLALICDVDTCANDPFIRGLLDHMSCVGEHRSIFEAAYADCDGRISDMTPAAIPSSKKANPSHKGDPREFNIATSKTLRPVLPKTSQSKTQSAQSQEQHAPGASIRAPVRRLDYTSELKRLVEEFVAGSLEIVEGVTCRIGEGELPSGVTGIAILQIQIPSQEEETVVKGKTSHEQAAAVLRFPPSLDSYCRCIVHELATTHSLHHRSVGLVPHRYIEISTQHFQSPPTPSAIPVMPTSVPLTPHELGETVEARPLPLEASNAYSALTPPLELTSDLKAEDADEGGEEEMKEKEYGGAEMKSGESDAAKGSAFDLSEISRIRAAKYKAAISKKFTPPASKATNKSASARAKGSAVKIDDSLDEADLLDLVINENKVCSTQWLPLLLHPLYLSVHNIPLLT
jgi:ATP-dependent RNA/DNA helicase IGHMBP2